MFQNYTIKKMYCLKQNFYLLTTCKIWQLKMCSRGNFLDFFHNNIQVTRVFFFWLRLDAYDNIRTPAPSNKPTDTRDTHPPGCPPSSSRSRSQGRSRCRRSQLPSPSKPIISLYSFHLKHIKKKNCVYKYKTPHIRLNRLIRLPGVDRILADMLTENIILRFP